MPGETCKNDLMPAKRAADDPQFAELVQEQVSLLSRKGWYHSIEAPGGSVIQGLISIDALKKRLSSFPIPDDLTGKRVLDVGAWTGWCSFEMERRGAEVVASDCVAFEEFEAARQMLGSSVEHRTLDVDELSPESVGLFDYVLLFGVLYHLRDPLTALGRICSITKEAAFVESFVLDDELGSERCLMEFYETGELGGQIDNWFVPNTSCLLAMCRSAGFARVDLEYVVERRAGVTCRRQWEPPDPHPNCAAPWINSAVNNRTDDIYFHKNKDEYVCLYFKTGEEKLTKEQLRVVVDGLGLPILALADLGRQGWQANFRVPPGLSIGPHESRLRTLHSPYSNPFEIIMRVGPTPVVHAARPDRREGSPAPVIYEVENSMTESFRFHGYKDERLCCRFRTQDHGLKREDVILEVDEVEQPVLFLTDLGNGCWQTNSRFPRGLASGAHRVRLRTVRSGFSSETEVFSE